MIKKTFNTEHYENLLILDNAHKIVKKSGLQDKPRHLIVQFHFLQKKENILQAAKKLGMVEYEGCKFRFVPDYSRALLGLRKSFHNVISELFKKQLRPALLYPARLRIWLFNGNNRFFNNLQDASSFLEAYGGEAATGS